MIKRVGSHRQMRIFVLNVQPPLPRSLFVTPSMIAEHHAFEFAIYVFVIVMPLLGWLSVSAEGKTISLVGLSLPRLIGENKDLAKQLEDVHGLIGNAGYALIGIHALAALIHHYRQRDNTLRRMLPSRQDR